MNSSKMGRDAPSAFSQTKRAMVTGASIVVMIALLVGVWGCVDARVAEQNTASDGAAGPAGGTGSDSATAADSAAASRAAASKTAFGSTAAEATQCLARHQSLLTTAAAARQADSTAGRAPSGRDPVRAVRYGWYPDMPEFRDGALLPCGRIIAYYGHPNATRMGVLGEYPKDEMLGRLKNQVAEWERADPATPVIPALHMVAVVAQGEAGRSGGLRLLFGPSAVIRIIIARPHAYPTQKPPTSPIQHALLGDTCLQG